MNIKDTVNDFVALRTRLEEKRKAFKAFEKETKAEMALLEIKMLDIANETGLESFSSTTHTAFKTTKSYARRSSEPEAFERLAAYVMDSGDFMVFTSHVNKLHLKELIEQDGINPEDIGLHWEEEQVMQVRKRTSQASQKKSMTGGPK